MKLSWSKTLFVAGDALLAVYIIMAFVSFDKKGESKAVCSKVNIEIADNATNGFLDAKEIKDRLQSAGLYPVGKRMNTISTRHIEETLRTSPFVKTAECYKTVGGAVYVSVTQRMPVIRIKSDAGDDYYVDDNDCIMPRTNYTSDLIIATGCISRAYATRCLSPFGKAVMQSDLWRNLIEQINILPNKGVEIVPRIGDHIVYIGKMPDGRSRAEREKAIEQFVEKKLKRLEKFYRYGLSVVGWNKYSYVNIEFDNQIICKKHDAQQYMPAPQPAHETDAAAPQTDAPQAEGTAAPAAAEAESAAADRNAAPKAADHSTAKAPAHASPSGKPKTAASNKSAASKPDKPKAAAPGTSDSKKRKSSN